MIRNRRLYKGSDTLTNIVLGITTSVFKTVIMLGPVCAYYSLFYREG